MWHAKRPVLWTHAALMSAFVFGASNMVHAEGPLDAYRWQNRIVVIFADQDTREDLARQYQMMLIESDGMRDRDLIVVTVETDLVEIDGVANPTIRADRLRDAFNVPKQGYSTLLVGKDGGVKLRSRQPVTTEDLFALIDGMPMRQREMREQSNSKS